MNTDKKYRISPVAFFLLILNVMLVKDAVQAIWRGTADFDFFLRWAGWLVGLNLGLGLLIWVIKSDGEMGYREARAKKSR